jgi:DNA-binding MarR family transcriptional regulator
LGEKHGRPNYNLALLLELAYKRLDAALIGQLRANGYADLRPAHSQVFGAIPPGGARVGEMAAQAGITQQSMSELVDALEHLGYLERRPDPGDRRARIIAFTERGWDAVRAGIATVDAIEREWAQLIGVRRADAMRAALEVIAFHDEAD